MTKTKAKARPKTKAKTKTKAAVKANPVSARKAVATKTVKARAPKARKTPETLRIKSFTPSLTVNDLTKSLAFYTDGLGFIIGSRWSGEDGVLRGVMLKAGASEFGISQDDWKQGKDRKKGVGLRIYFDTVQDIDAIAARVKAAGHALTDEPSDSVQWGVRSFSVDDPDGFHLTITRNL
ncbi:MAG: VOC family protein [Vicinamibacteria bacterium]